MNSTIVILTSLIVVVFSLYVVFIFRGFPGSTQYAGWKISGIWENNSRTIQVLIHNNGSTLRGHVVRSTEDDKIVRGKIVGSLILKEVKLKSFWRWSSGIYIDPMTNKEFPLRLRLRNNKSLSLHFFENAGGEVLIKEEWQLVNPLL